MSFGIFFNRRAAQKATSDRQGKASFAGSHDVIYQANYNGDNNESRYFKK